MADTTLATQVNSLATRVATVCKGLKGNVGDLSGLATTAKTSLVAAINEVKENSGSSADDITYGEYGYDSVKDALDQLLYKTPQINSFTNNVGTVEMGSTVTNVTLSWSTNKTPTSLTLDGEAVTATDTSKVLSGQSIKSNKSWTLKMTDEKGATAQKSTSISFLNGVYYGVGTVTDASGVNNAFIQGLTKTLANSKAKTFTVTAGAGQYIYYCVPARFGTVGFNVGGFDGGFTLLATVDYTNPSGYKESYSVYKSDNANLGNTTVTCK